MGGSSDLAMDGAAPLLHWLAGSGSGTWPGTCPHSTAGLCALQVVSAQEALREVAQQLEEAREELGKLAREVRRVGVAAGGCRGQGGTLT